MKRFVTQHRLQIERVVTRYRTGAAWAFFKKPESANVLCDAWVSPDSSPEILLSAKGRLSPEEASTVSVAIGMALDWIAEESGKHAAHTPELSA